MLSVLHIENIAVIEQADIEFSDGFTVLSGETGAGKSIIIDSIGAIMGQRTSKELIRNGAKKGFVSAMFTDISEILCSMLCELGLEGEDNRVLHIQRELSADGKSVCRVNMRPVAASVLKSLSPYLINIHGQHDGQKLLSEEYHIDFLDSYCDAQKELSLYRPLYQKLFALKKRMREMERSEQERIQRMDMLRVQCEEIEGAELEPGEEEQLQERKAYYDNAGRLTGALGAAFHLLNGDDDTEGACSALVSVSNELEDIAGVSDDLQTLLSNAENVRYLAQDLADSILSILNRIDFSPEERDHVEERLDLLYRLQRKYGSSEEEILAYLESAQKELKELEYSDERREELRVEYRQTLAQAKEIALRLSEKRKKAARRLVAEIISELKDLDMTKVRMEITVQPQQKLTANGVDEVAFLLSANPGEPLRPLSKIASGGELSRIMLALKNILTINEDVGTLIFDEIDVGVSGRAAQKIAKKLCSISRKKQTLCVTHLPQIAAMGDGHFLIAKSDCDGKTYTTVFSMSEQERKKELARMLSGEQITELSLQNAGELLDHAAEYKKGVS